MKFLRLNSKLFLLMKLKAKIIRGSQVMVLLFFIVALSCTDHIIDNNLPESNCKVSDGSERLYPCEFIIEKIAILDKDGGEISAVTGSTQALLLSRFRAKTNSNSGSVAGETGFAVFDIKMTLKRVATPSFPVREGYLIGYTNNSSGGRILHTPSFPGDTYGERTKIGMPITTLDMNIGETREITFERTFPYRLESVGGSVRPISIHNLISFFVDNDVTTLRFDRTTGPYRFVSGVTETYFEKLTIGFSE